LEAGHPFNEEIEKNEKLFEKLTKGSFEFFSFRFQGDNGSLKKQGVLFCFFFGQAKKKIKTTNNHMKFQPLPFLRRQKSNSQSFFAQSNPFTRTITTK
jgi:hypothetical protein